ncbi:MAG: anthranilate phosphoribosyltransferase, partial [Archangium sp.]
YAEALKALGSSHAWIVHGRDGLDELSISGPTQIAILEQDTVTSREITPEDAGLKRWPLTNPAGARYQLLGTFAGERLEQTARVLSRLGSKRAWVVHGRDGLDELSPCTVSDVAELREDGSVRTFTLSPEDAGLERVPPESIVGGDVEDNARRLQALLAGERSGVRTAVLLNAAAALVVVGRAADLKQGVLLAVESIDSGAAAAKLKALVKAGAA